MHCAIYARVSTLDKGQDTENQLLQLRKFALANDWTIVEFIDHETAKHSDRAQFQAMFQSAARREIDVVLFWSLDRFTREGALPTLQHLNVLSSYGVGFRSFTELYLDTCGIFKDAVISILATVAKQERLRISERTKAGMDRARRAGKECHRPMKVFQRDRVAKLRDLGMSWRGIAKELGVSTGTARREYGSFLAKAAKPS